MENQSKYEKILTDLQQDLQERLKKIEDHIRHRDGAVSQDFAEQVSERENDDVVNALDDTLLAELDAVTSTLERIERGTFGTCSICGNDIEVGRLDALPYATTCVACKDLH